MARPTGRYAAFERCCPRSLGVGHFVGANGRARHEHRDSWGGTRARSCGGFARSQTDLEDSAFSPTFILGAAHSGTTILYRMFALHPEVLWFSQFSLRSGEIAGRWSLPFNDPIDSALRQFTRHDWQKVSSRRLQWIVPTPSEVRNVWKDLLDRSGTTDERAAYVRWCVEFSVHVVAVDASSPSGPASIGIYLSSTPPFHRPDSCTSCGMAGRCRTG